MIRCLIFGHKWKFVRKETLSFDEERNNKKLQSIITQNAYECSKCGKMKREAINWACAEIKKTPLKD